MTQALAIEQSVVEQRVLGFKDPAAIEHKVACVDSKLYWVNVMAPGPEEHDETVWRHRNPTISTSYPSFQYGGPDLELLLEEGHDVTFPPTKERSAQP